MIRPLVYLAGGIAGLSGHAATSWREDAARELFAKGLETLDPMRAKASLKPHAKISENFNDYAGKGVFFTSAGIMARDHNDVARCDALLVNLLGAVKPSMGTIMELAWAYDRRKPVVVAIEADNVHLQHPMVFEAVGAFRFDTLQDAIDSVAIVLGR